MNAESETAVVTYPNLLSAAREVVSAYRHGCDWQPAAEVLSDAVRVFEMSDERHSEAKLPLKACDLALNRVLKQQQYLVRFECWLRENRELLEASFTGRYHSIDFDPGYSSNWRLRIYGADDAKKLARAFGGKWTRKRCEGSGGTAPYFDYECDNLPGLGLPCTLAAAEMLPTLDKSPLELDLESEVAA